MMGSAAAAAAAPTARRDRRADTQAPRVAAMVARREILRQPWTWCLHVQGQNRLRAPRLMGDINGTLADDFKPYEGPVSIVLVIPLHHGEVKGKGNTKTEARPSGHGTRPNDGIPPCERESRRSRRLGCPTPRQALALGSPASPHRPRHESRQA